jgi:hypothetical protein
MKSEALGDAGNPEENTLLAAPPHVEILSPAEAINFPDQWYEIMDERHFWMVWRTRAFLRSGADTAFCAKCWKLQRGGKSTRSM